MERNQFTFYRSYFDALKKVHNKSDQLKLFSAICELALNGNDTDLNGTAGAMFDLIRPTILKGNRLASNRLSSENKSITNEKQTDNNSKSNPQGVRERDRERVRERVRDRDIKENIQKKFTPPTVEEVEAYNAERGSRVDCQRFVDFYTSKGWKVGREPMKDWRAAFRTWERNSRAETIKPSPKTPIAPQQRATIDDIERYKKLIAEM